MASLETNVKQVNADFIAIKDSIVASGVEVANGTKTADYAEKVTEVYEAGKRAELVALWNTLQDNGNRRSYQHAFYKGSLTFTDYFYHPQYPIICDDNLYSAEALFSDNELITDTKVQIIISNTRADTCFRRCINLKRIPSLTLEKIVRFSNTFERCNSLEELYMYGEVDIDGLKLQWSTKLNKASIESVINCLSTTTSGLTVTLSQEAVNTAFETSEGAADGSTSSEWLTLAGTKDNWTIDLA